MIRVRLAALWRYPVKSMQGEPLAGSLVEDGGLAGDRRYALLDLETNTIASAKHPRRWRGLLQCRARYLEEPRPGEPAPIEITSPDGSSVRSGDPGVHAWLSAMSGRRVRLVNSPLVAAERDTDRSPLDQLETGSVIRREPLALLAPAGSFYDVAPIHVLGTSALEQLARSAPGGMAPVRRFRPNLLVAPMDPTESVDELAWIGQVIRIGEVPLTILDPTPRCVLTTLAQRELPAAPGLLRAIHAGRSAVSRTVAPGHRFSGVLGVYARAERAGSLRVDDDLPGTAPGESAAAASCGDPPTWEPGCRR